MMAEVSTQDKAAEVTKVKLCPAVAMYGPKNVLDLQPGELKKWCTCGLSTNQPWCDGKHKGTGFKSLHWRVPEIPQTRYEFCLCKHTKSPPLCDGTHTGLPCAVLERQANCATTAQHTADCKLCTGCGWVPDF